METTTETLDEGTSTLEPPSAFMGTNRNLPESSCSRNCKNAKQKLLMDSPRRGLIEGTVRLPFFGMLPEDEWEKHHRDHEKRTGCRMDRVAVIKEAPGSSSELRNPENFESRSEPITNVGIP